MIYNSFNFVILFPLMFLLYYGIPAKYKKARNLFLLVVSYLLYLNWKPVYALILLGVTIVTYISACRLENNRRPKSVMVVGIILALLPLLFFKYFNFINENIYEFLSAIGIRFQLLGLNWAIPIGISFFTFQAMGYLWDVYYKKIPAERDFLTYALFISFFPSILSGPINKASLLISQLKNLRPYFDYLKAVGGLKMLLWGMFMKVVVADRVAIYVDMIFRDYMSYSSASCFVASVLYSIQIYTDFAGYSLMAIGVGKTLGFELTENFRRPYFAYSVTDFWHRWHISFSTWLKDYVYIPLGGSRCSKLCNYRNILLTFFISGLWHGANWTFVVWGLCHGAFQVIEKLLGQQKCTYGILGKTVKVIITFMLVNFAWIFFRMPTLTDACGVICRIFNFSLPLDVQIYGITNTFLISVGVMMLLIRDITDEFYPNKFLLFNNQRIIVRWSIYLFIMIAILLAGVFISEQFIYVNF
ncbi:MBOAT family O-acyltransferase [Bacteroides heparinolyticus]|uniref:MBOAT family O-acyltransferase n=1 Tax=Prevotella heparinolytica TaxID=28113 RepID=UPI00359FED16